MRVTRRRSNGQMTMTTVMSMARIKRRIRRTRRISNSARERTERKTMISSITKTLK